MSEIKLPEASEAEVVECLRAGIASANPNFYAEAKPFPHAVVDHLLPESACHYLASLFPPVAWTGWRMHANKNTLKRDCGNALLMPPDVAKVVRALNSAPVVKALAALTGIPDLQPDPGLEGGGMHRTDRGGFLGIHRDFNLTPDKKKRRQVNLLLYLNACAGGNLEMWGEENYRPARKEGTVHPDAGRAVIFNTGGPAWHGHPRPLESAHRFSLAAYYYTDAEADAARHLTIYSEAGR
jgi:hypothetical protein